MYCTGVKVSYQVFSVVYYCSLSIPMQAVPGVVNWT